MVNIRALALSSINGMVDRMWFLVNPSSFPPLEHLQAICRNAWNPILRGFSCHEQAAGLVVRHADALQNQIDYAEETLAQNKTRRKHN